MTPSPAPIQKCAGCAAPIRWAYTENGKRMPFDADPLDPAGVGPGAYRIEGHRCHAAEPMFDPPGTQYFMSHFATCPDADQFRRTRRKES